MTKKYTRRFFLASAGGGVLNTVQPLLPTLIGGSVLGVAYACPSGEPPDDPVVTRKKKSTRERTHSTAQFVRLTDVQIRKLIADHKRSAALRRKFRIQGYTNSASLKILEAAAAERLRKLIQKWIRRMARMRSKKELKDFLERESEKLRKLRLAEEAKQKALKKKIKEAKAGDFTQTEIDEAIKFLGNDLEESEEFEIEIGRGFKLSDRFQDDFQPSQGTWYFDEFESFR